jgi:hypothetical protein
MKNLKLFLLPALFVAATFIYSCNSDDDNDSTTNFLSSYLSQSGFNQTTDEVVNSDSYEFGSAFHVTADGKMTKITVKIPDTNPDVRVTVWNVVGGTVLRTEHVNVTTAGEAETVDITDLQLEANTLYAITMNSDSWYDREREDGDDVTYPFLVGNVSIDSYLFGSGTDQTFPSGIANGYYAGDLSFTFDKD